MDAFLLNTQIITVNSGWVLGVVMKKHSFEIWGAENNEKNIIDRIFVVPREYQCEFSLDLQLMKKHLFETGRAKIVKKKNKTFLS